MHRTHPDFVWKALHSAAILRVLEKKRHIKRDLIRSQVRKVLKDDFRDHYFNVAYWSLLDLGMARQQLVDNQGYKVYPTKRKMKNGDRVLRNRKHLKDASDYRMMWTTDLWRKR